MLTPVPATLPDSTLAPADIARKFQSTSLAGLGSYCDDYPDECGMGSGTGTGTSSGGGSVDLCAVYPTPGCPNWTGGSGGYPPPEPSYDPVSTNPTHATDYSALLSQLIKSGVDVSKLALVQPGTTLTASGAVSRQNPGFAIPSGATIGVNAGGNGMMYLVLGAAALFLFMQSKK